MPNLNSQHLAPNNSANSNTSTADFNRRNSTPVVGNSMSKFTAQKHSSDLGKLSNITNFTTHLADASNKNLLDSGDIEMMKVDPELRLDNLSE